MQPRPRPSKIASVERLVTASRAPGHGRAAGGPLPAHSAQQSGEQSPAGHEPSPAAGKGLKRDGDEVDNPVPAKSQALEEVELLSDEDSGGANGALNTEESFQEAANAFKERAAGSRGGFQAYCMLNRNQSIFGYTDLQGFTSPEPEVQQCDQPPC